MTRAKIIDIIKSSMAGSIRLDNKAEYKDTYSIDDIDGNGLITKDMLVNSLPVVPVIELLGITADTSQSIDSGIIVEKIYIIKNSGSIILSIGLTPDGVQLVDNEVLGPFNNFQIQQYFAAAGDLYFDLTGTGNIDIYIYYTQLF